MLIKNKQLKQLLEQIQDDWNSLNDKLEIDIVEKYAGNMRLLTISSMAICYISVFFFGVFQRLPLILDAVLPLNESRPYQLFVMTEYFVSQDKYIHIMLLHEFLTVYIGLTTVCSTGLAIIIYMVHICVLLKIASYRIENAIKKNVLAIPSPRREYFLHRRIVHAVIIHQRAIEYHTFFMSVFLLPFGFLIAVGVNSVAFILFLSFQLMASNSKSMSFIAVGLVLICLTYMFVGNYYGQAVIDSGISLFKATYNGLWYSAPLSTQKLLLFIMQRGRIHLTFTFYSILISSLDGFAVLTSMAVSYFTVIYAMQK